MNIEQENFTHSAAERSCEYILSMIPDFKPKIGLVLGSGLSSLSKQIQSPIHLSYEDLPGFPKISVDGHQGQLTMGFIHDTPIICLQGRKHHYEGQDSETVKTYVRTLKLLGCEYFIATNASGSIRPEVGPGSLMMITDHINFQGTNPLIGPNDDRFGPRFYPLDDAYDKNLQKKLLEAAELETILLHQGVYVCVTGPHYETKAEIKAFSILGGDAVGMSTVPEVLVAKHCGMKIAVIASITNFATGLDTTSHSHEAVLKKAEASAEQLSRLIRRFIALI